MATTHHRIQIIIASVTAWVIESNRISTWISFDPNLWEPEKRNDVQTAHLPGDATGWLLK
jgi:hypothetical protein